jgi:CRP-like cAMP-binding protein
MFNSSLTRGPSPHHRQQGSVLRVFKRGEYLPLHESQLWQIKVGSVRAHTLNEDGTLITLGFWQAGDTVGQPLICIQPYQIDCLTAVTAHSIKPDTCSNANQLLLAHLQQAQTLLQIRSGQMEQRLTQLIDWLAYKFGCESGQGRLIRLRLTHQNIADAVGTTRVTVTRLLKKFEDQGKIRWIKKYLLVSRSAVAK